MKYKIEDEEMNEHKSIEFDCVVLFKDKKTLQKTVTYIDEIYEYIEAFHNAGKLKYSIKDILTIGITTVGGKYSFSDIKLEKDNNENILG